MRLVLLACLLGALILPACSGCHSQPQVQVEDPSLTDAPEEPSGFDENNDVGPTDGIEVPDDERDLVPATEPDING